MEQKVVDKLKNMSVDDLTRHKHKIEDQGQQLDEEHGHRFDSDKITQKQESVKLMQKLIDQKKDLAGKQGSRKDRLRKI